MQILKAKNINIFSATILLILLLGSFILSSNVNAQRSTPVTVVNSADDPLPVEIQGLNSTPNFFSETNIFVHIDGIPGDSEDDRHRDWIEAISYSQSVENSASAVASSSGGGSGERSSFGDIIIVKNIDCSSPKLYGAVAHSTHISSVIIECETLCGDPPLKFFEVELENVVISSISFEGMETVGFNFGKIRWTFTEQIRADGSGGGNIVFGWDLERNLPY